MKTSKNKRTESHWCLVSLLAVLFLLFATQGFAMEVTLQWDANQTNYLVGYRLYFKTGTPGNRELGEYGGPSFTWVGAPYDGQTVVSGFEIRKDDLPDPKASTVTCTLSGLQESERYFFVVTAIDNERLESRASNEEGLIGVEEDTPVTLQVINYAKIEPEMVMSVEQPNNGTAIFNHSNKAMATITVNPENDAPEARDNVYAANSDGTLMVSATDGVLGNDSDPEGDSLTASLIEGPSNGTLTLNPDGSFSYAANEGFTGNDGFTYQCDDGNGGSDTAMVNLMSGTTVGPIVLYTFEETGDPKTVKDVSGVGPPLDLTLEDEGAVSWISGGGLSITSATLIKSTGPATKVVEAVRASQAITIEAWVRPANTTQEGPARIVTFSENPSFRNFTLGQTGDQYDVRLRTTTTTTNGLPSLTATPDSATTELTHIVYTRDASGVAKIYINGFESASREGSGDFSNWDSSYTLALANEITKGRTWLGELHLVAIFDRALAEGEITLRFVARGGILPRNRRPVTKDDSYTVPRGGTVDTIANNLRGILANDSDPDGDSLTATLINGPSHGVLGFNPNGTFSYTHDGSDLLFDSFSYLAEDGRGGNGMATVTIISSTVNNDFVAVNDTYQVQEGRTLTVEALAGILSNDTNPAGNPHAALRVFNAGPSNGALALNTDGSFTYVHDGSDIVGDSFLYMASDGILTYTPNRDFHGTDRFRYTLWNSTSPATGITVRVTPVNDAPVASDGAVTTVEDNAMAFALITEDVEGDTLTYMILDAPTYGGLTGTAPNVIYSPQAGYVGMDYLTFRVNDGQVDSNTATVTIEVLQDTDEDDMPDTWEQANGLDPGVDDSAADLDDDGLSSLQEYERGTDPWDMDSDRDTFADGTEVVAGSDPLDPGSIPDISLKTSGLRVTDVTPRSFSLVWVANQAASCSALLYTDPEGNNRIVGFTIIDESTDHPPAAENGVMKANVSGLIPNTTYYFRIVTRSSDGVLVEPGNGPLPSVRTESSTVIVSNDVITHRIFRSDGVTPATGALLIAGVEGGSYPVTGWVGEGIAPPRVLVDLNNIYSATEHKNLELFGGEALTLESIGGLMGFRRLSGTVPVEIGGINTLSPEPDDGQCTLDTGPPVVDGATIQPVPGELIEESLPLIGTNYSDEYSDIDLLSVRLFVDGMEVTDQSTVSATGIAYTPLTPLSDGTHSVSLLLSDEWGYGADPVSWSFLVDATAPIIHITQPTNEDHLYPAQQMVRWDIVEPNLTDLSLSINEIPQTLAVDAVEATVVLEPGVNSIEITAVDSVGHSVNAFIEVTLDSDYDGDGIGDYYDPDDDNDFMSDIWEVINGLDPFDSFDTRLDADGDGHSNLTEYTAGTDPQDPSSYPSSPPAINHITVTDVTPNGFSVLWQSTEPSSGTLDVFDDTGVLLDDPLILSESEGHLPAEEIGVIKVTVSGLLPGTTYRFQTLTTALADGVVVYSPLYPELMEVTTVMATSAVNNDPIKQMIYDGDGNSADGTLLVVLVEGGDYPVSAWVGDGVLSPWAEVDLNQIYSRVTHENLQLLGGEELALWSFGGILGNFVNFQRVPVPSGTVQTALTASSRLTTESGYSFDLKSDLNIVGIQYGPVFSQTSHSLLLFLKGQGGGDPGVVESIRRYNRETGSWETASWFLAEPAGMDFPIKAGEAYLIYMEQDMNDVWFGGVAQGAIIDLAPGLNLVNLPAIEDSFQYSGYEMLLDLGDASQVSSAQRYDATAGWQTTSWFNGLPSGEDFDTRKGEGYLIYIKEEKKDWRPY